DFSTYSSYSQSQYSPYYNTHYNSPYITTSNITPSAITTAIPYQHTDHPAVSTNHSPESHTAEYHAPTSPPTPGKEQEVAPVRRSSDGKLRGRKRANDPVPPLDSDIEVQTLAFTMSLTQHLSLTFLCSGTQGLLSHPTRSCVMMSGNNLIQHSQE
ncbi:hypothetical protein cypCar_00039040, partial [Cyprinus carpio]